MTQPQPALPAPPALTPPGPLLAYHGDPARKEFYLARVRAHRAADEVVRGQYWQADEDGVFRGCAVGCTIHSSEHAAYETHLGMPQVLAKLEDSIFEDLPEERALAWLEEFLTAARTGADLSLVWPRFAVWLLTDPDHGVLRFAKSDAAKRAIQDVADAYTRVIHGERVTKKEWQRLRTNADAADADAAAAAAYAYVYASRAASYAAYYAAYYAYCATCPDADAEARMAQADQLLELMSNA